MNRLAVPGSPEVLFEDRRFLVVDKPAGMPVHANRAGVANVEDFFSGWRLGKAGPWLAHRLDQDTAGCLLIARRKSALLAAQALFGGGEVRKTYWAVVAGRTAPAGEIDLPLVKLAQGRSWKMVPGASAPARTGWRLRGGGEDFSWLELYPRTGRTHQIRAHCAAIGHPVLGDGIYGGGEGPLCLLAQAIFLDLQPPVEATAPVPPHMREKLQSCGWTEDDV